MDIEIIKLPRIQIFFAKFYFFVLYFICKRKAHTRYYITHVYGMKRVTFQKQPVAFSVYSHFIIKDKCISFKKVFFFSIDILYM